MRKFLPPFILALLLLFAAPVYAQDAATPDAAPVVSVTAEPNPPGVTVNVQQPDTPVAAPVDTNALGTFGLYALLALIGGGSFALVLSRLDKRGLDALEKAYESTSPATQATILEIVNILAGIVKVGQEVTDGKPNDVPPASGSNSG